MKIIEGPKGHPPTPWRDYADGQWRLAEPGIDYDDPAKFRSVGKTWSNRYGQQWQSELTEDGVRFCISARL